MRTEVRLNARHAALARRIDMARQRLAENQKLDWAELGNMLEEFSRDLETLEAADAVPSEEAGRQAVYDRIDGHLNDIHAKLDTARPTD